jgi:predicted dehydrogenase
MNLEDKNSRRSFIKKSAAAAFGIAIVPRFVLGNGYVAPSDKLNIAVIGGGGKGFSDAMYAYANGYVNITAICDVDWSRAEKLFKQFPKAKRYKDYRVLLDEMKDIDAITVSTPDHNHAIITHAAMQLGLDTYVQKPLTHNIHEARVLTQAAEKYKIVTQMGNQGASSRGTNTMIKWFDEGRIGAVDLVHVWTNRPVWAQGIANPSDKVAMIDGLAWDNWIGPAKYVDYHPSYHPFSWRGWWNFGTGALGDVGCHLIDPPYRVLGLGYPTEVESSVGTVYAGRKRPHYPDSCPPSSRTQLTFPATAKNPKKLKMTWTDGGLRPFHPDLIPADHPLGEKDSANGVIMMGEKGIMICGMYGDNPKIYLNTGEIITMPEENEQDKARIALPAHGHHHDWVEACKAGFGSKEHKALTSSFDISGPLTETVLMGNLAIRSYALRGEKVQVGKRTRFSYPGRKKLLWDGENMRITNFEEANQFVGREYRKGWQL